MLAKKTPYNDITNGVIPEATDDSVLPWQEVYRDVKNRLEEEAKETDTNLLDHYTKIWKKFKSENKAIVAYLAKEFEMRKSADEHQRTRMAKTGELNTAILHTYKFNEDLFKKAAVVAEGKNHGLVMVVDWSGSMSRCIVDTISQIQIMAMFCKQVNIPFDVYAFNGHFTGVYKKVTDNNIYEGTVALPPSFTTEDDEISLERQPRRDGTGQGTFKLINYLSSTMRQAQFETAMAYFTAIKESFNRSYSYGRSRGLRLDGWHRLGGTPLTESIVAAAKVVNEFRAKYRLQVVNTIFLTDGEGNYSQRVHGNPDNNYGEMVLHDRKTKRFYKPTSKGGYATTFQAWLDWFYDRTGMRIINFYIYGSSKGELTSAFRSFDIPMHKDAYGYDQIITAEDMKEITKKGFYYRDDVAGYRSVFFIRAKNLKVADDHMKSLDDAASLAKKRNAFIRNQRDKLGSRMFMDQVAKLIA